MKVCYKGALWLVFLLSLFGIIGCGSSGSSGGDDEGVYTLSFQLIDDNTGDELIDIGFGDRAKLRVQVNEPGGAPAQGRRVTADFMNNQCRFIDSSDGSGVTDADGVVEMYFELVTGATGGSETISVTSDLPLDSTYTSPAAEKNFAVDLSNTAGTIEFVSATPALIGLLGTTNAPNLLSQSVLEFIVKDNQANPVYGQFVNFSLTTDVGGITLAPSMAETDLDGKVTVTVKAGNVPTSVRVRAEIDNTSFFTLSDELILSTGFPDQNSFSMSADIFNPEGMNYDGEEVTVTIRAGDRNNNPVPDGTDVYFTTEGGVIDSSCTTTDGACSVTWRSQDPRYDGRITILAYAQGEESFQDLDGNGLYNDGVDLLLTDLPEAFLDADYDGVRDLDEIFVAFNNDDLYSLADGMYNGTLCDAASPGCSSDLIHVRADMEIVMAESFANIELSPSTTIYFDDIYDATQIVITVSGINYGNSMPNGTTVAVTAPDNAEIQGDSSFTVENALGPNVFAVTLVPDESGLATSSTLLVEVETPKGNTSSASLGVTAPPSAEFVFEDGDSDYEVDFQDRSTTAPGTTITSWAWSFGDGDTSSVKNPSHSFSDDHEYQVSLTVTNNRGQSHTYTEEVTPPEISEEETPTP